jgi:hypothetical protein
MNLSWCVQQVAACFEGTTNQNRNNLEDEDSHFFWACSDEFAMMLAGLWVIALIYRNDYQ